MKSDTTKDISRGTRMGESEGTGRVASWRGGRKGDGHAGARAGDGLMVPEMRTETWDCVRRTIFEVGGRNGHRSPSIKLSCKK